VGHLDRGWQAAGTFGVLGAAAAAARVAGADPTLTASALGIAGTQAAGLGSAAGDPLAAIVAGRSAANAVESLLLARNGFSAPMRIIEGRRGFGEVVGAGGDYAGVVDGLGTDWRADAAAADRLGAALGATEGPGSILAAWSPALAHLAAGGRAEAASRDARDVVAAAAPMTSATA
jgi:hypothetical protein